MVTILGVLGGALFFVALMLGAFGVSFSIALPFIVLGTVLLFLFWICILTGVGKSSCSSSEDACKRYLNGEVDNSPF